MSVANIIMNHYPDIILYEHSGDVYSLDFSNEGSLLASVNSNGSIRVCYPMINQDLWSFDSNLPVELVRFSPDSRRVVATASNRATLDTWEVGTGKFKQIETPECNRYIRFNPLSNLLAAVDIHGVCTLWDLEYGSAAGGLDFYGEPIVDFSFSSDGTLIAVSQGTKVHIWDAVHEGLFCSLNGHRSELAAAAFSPNSRYVASGDNQGTVIFSEIHTLRTVWSFSETITPIRSLAFNSSGNRLAVAYANRCIEIIDVYSGKSEILLYFPNEIFELTFSQVDKCLAVAGVGSLRIWCEGSDLVASDKFPGATAKGWIKPRQVGQV